MRFMRQACVLAFAAAALCTPAAFAAEPDVGERLFRDLYSGMLREELEAKGAIVPFGKAKNGLWGRKDVEFAGKHWKLLCQFVGSSLDYVALHAPDGTGERSSAVLQMLEAEGYSLIAVRADGEVRDTPAQLLRPGIARKTLADVANEATRYKNVRYVLVRDTWLRQGEGASGEDQAAKDANYAPRVDIFAGNGPPASCRVIFSVQRLAGGKSMDTGPEKRP